MAYYYRRQYKHICIDEAQDLNEAQYRLLLSLCGSEFRNVMMVGDPKQAIYVWNGANPKYLDLFQRDFKAGMIELTETFRSAQAVVAAAQRLDASYTVEGQLPIPSRVIGSILPHSAVAKAEELWEAEQERKKKRPRKHRK